MMNNQFKYSAFLKKPLSIACFFACSIFHSNTFAENINYVGDPSDFVLSPPGHSLNSSNTVIRPISDSFYNEINIDFIYDPGISNAPNSVLGGYAYELEYIGVGNIYMHAENNKVIFNNGKVWDGVYGGFAHAQGDISRSWAYANRNTVILNNTATVTNVYGGYAASLYSSIAGSRSYANENIVNINDYADVFNIFGGYSITAMKIGGTGLSNADYNTININDHAIVSFAFGGFSTMGLSSHQNTQLVSHADYNTINVNGFATVGALYGGDSRVNSSLYNPGWAVANALYNTVNVNGHASIAEIVGGVATTYGTSSALFNTVNINGNVLITGDVVGGMAGYSTYQHTVPTYAAAKDNVVNINDNASFSINSKIYGGVYSSVGIHPANNNFDVFTGNTLNFAANPIRVREIGNFEYYNFVLPSIAGGSSIPLITVNNITLDSSKGKDIDKWLAPSKVQVIGIKPGVMVNVGDQFILLQATDTMTGNVKIVDSTVTQGISLEYDVDVEQDVGNRQITATITNRKVKTLAAKVNPQLKALSEGKLAGVMLSISGADLIANDLLTNISEQSNADSSSLASFVTTGADYSRYNSGSHIDSDNVNVVGGISYQNNALTLGAFAEGGWGSYDSYNSFYNAANVHGIGDTSYYGGGLFGHYKLNNGIYLEGSVRLGEVKTDFNSSDLKSIDGTQAQYDTKSNYISAHTGLGYIFNLNDNNVLDISTKYLWTQVAAADVTVAGDPIHFDEVNSNRIRAMAQWKHKVNPQTSFNTGLGYEYELDSKVSATTYHIYQIEAPDVEGGTGIVEAGINIKPIERSDGSGLSLDIKAKGSVGKREGIGASMQLKYQY